MGLFGKIFGEKKPKTIEVELNKALEFLEAELSPKRKRLLEASAKLLAEIKHLLRETDSSLQKLREAQLSGGSKRLQKIVKTAKANALLQLSSLLEKMQPPNTNDLAAIKAYCSESMLALQKAGRLGKNVAYAGISFKDEVKSVGLHMRQLSQAFASLQQLLNENKAVFLQDELKKSVSELKSLGQDIASGKKEITQLQNRLEGIALEKSRLKLSLQRLRLSDEFKRIDELNGKKAELLREKQHAKTELLDMFAKVEKPLHRLDKAVNARKVYLAGQQASFLHDLLLNPFRALKRDPKAEILKEVLLETRKAVQSGLIELKEREREKKLALLQELLSFDFFSESFWKFNRLDSQLLAVEKQLRALPVIKKELQLLASLKQLQEREEQANKAMDLKNSEVGRSQAAVQELRQVIQRLLSNATGKSVALKC